MGDHRKTRKAPRHRGARGASGQGASNQTAVYNGWQAHVIRCTSAATHHRCDAPAGRTWNPAAMTAANCERADAGGSDLLELLLHAVPFGKSRASWRHSRSSG